MQEPQRQEPESVPTLGRAERRKAERTRRLQFGKDIARLKAFSPQTKALRRRSGRRSR